MPQRKRARDSDDPDDSDMQPLPSTPTDTEEDEGFDHTQAAMGYKRLPDPTETSSGRRQQRKQVPPTTGGKGRVQSRREVETSDDDDAPRATLRGRRPAPRKRRKVSTRGAVKGKGKGKARQGPLISDEDADGAEPGQIESGLLVTKSKWIFATAHEQCAYHSISVGPDAIRDRNYELLFDTTAAENEFEHRFEEEEMFELRVLQISTGQCVAWLKLPRAYAAHVRRLILEYHYYKGPFKSRRANLVVYLALVLDRFALELIGEYNDHCVLEDSAFDLGHAWRSMVLNPLLARAIRCVRDDQYPMLERALVVQSQFRTRKKSTEKPSIEDVNAADVSDFYQKRDLLLPKYLPGKRFSFLPGFALQY